MGLAARDPAVSRGVTLTDRGARSRAALGVEGVLGVSHAAWGLAEQVTLVPEAPTRL